MDMIEVKMYLRQVQMLDIKIDQRIKQRDDLLHRAMHSGGSKQNDPVKHSVNGDALSDAVARAVDLEKEIDAMIDDYTALKNVIISQIQMLTDARFVSLLYKRYVELKKLDKIAEEMCYDPDWTKKLHGYALLAFKDLLETH